MVNNSMKYDVVVVGAGPAGSVTAKTAAEKGLDVLLIERNPEIGVHVKCAEALNTKTIPKTILKKIDKRCICTKPTEANFYSPDGTCVNISSISGVYILNRNIFDKSLAIEAEFAGASIQVNTHVSGLIKAHNQVKGVNVRNNGKEYRILADVVVGADGVGSRIGRMAGIDTRLPKGDICVCAQYFMCGVEDSIDEHTCDLYFGNEVAPGGYAWAFPKGNGCANIGLGIRGNFSKEGYRASDYLKKFVKHKFPKGKSIVKIHGAVPVSGPVYETVSDGLVLVGDAARQVDPATGGGILYAIQAGIIAGEVISEAKDENDFSKKKLMKYEKRWKRSFGKVLMKRRKLRDLTDEELNRIAHGLPSRIEADKKIGGLILLAKIYNQNPWLFTKS